MKYPYQNAELCSASTALVFFRLTGSVIAALMPELAEAMRTSMIRAPWLRAGPTTAWSSGHDGIGYCYIMLQSIEIIVIIDI